MSSQKCRASPDAASLGRRKFAKHLRQILSQSFRVTRGVVREVVAFLPPPNQFVGFCIEDIHHQCANLCFFGGRGGASSAYSAAETTPSPTAESTTPETVVERLCGGLIPCRLERDERCIATRFNALPSLGGKLRIDAALNAITPQAVDRLHLAPSVGFVLREVY